MRMFLNRDLSWLAFARRVLAIAEDESLPVLERVKFAGIMGMLHDEFFMKRMSGLKHQMSKRSAKRSIDGLLPAEQFGQCRREILAQCETLRRVLEDELRPALAGAGVPLLDYAQLPPDHKAALRDTFVGSIAPILTPLAVDAEHPFPFISNQGLNLAVLLPGGESPRDRFLRVKVPDNHPRWVPLPDGVGFVALEQVIAANLDLMFPQASARQSFLFRVTRGAVGDRSRSDDLGDEPGSIVRLVSLDLKARRFAGVVRLEVEASMPRGLIDWLAEQLGVGAEDVYTASHFLAFSDLLKLEVPGREDLRQEYPEPVTHPRLAPLDPADPAAIFDEIRRGDILLHHPYQSFESSVQRFLESAAADPAVLAIKLTIYRTNSNSPIVKALAEAARRGKQVAVLVEITARFDEAPNIAWGRYLENEGVHVAYGVESLKTHVKLALVIRDENGSARRYAHVGTGNYHAGTARLYEDLGLLTAAPDICEDVAAVFNSLTGATPHTEYRRMIVAPATMRERFVALIRREVQHARAARPSGIRAKLNQLQDAEMIRELYRASQAGVPIELNVRGLCCLRPGVAGLSETIRVFSVVGRYLEHGRIYRFENGGDPEYFIGSADWMKRNLARRVETIAPVLDAEIKRDLDAILDVYGADNCSAWDCDSDGSYTRRQPAPGSPHYAAQEILSARARGLDPLQPEEATAGALQEPGGSKAKRLAATPTP